MKFNELDTAHCTFRFLARGSAMHFSLEGADVCHSEESVMGYLAMHIHNLSTASHLHLYILEHRPSCPHPIRYPGSSLRLKFWN